MIIQITKTTGIATLFSKVVITLIFAITGLQSAMGQMSGTYTINNTIGASSTNFRDWRSVWQAIQGISRNDLGPSTGTGVSGPVVIDVQSSITETVAVQFPAVSGVSATNTITINGGGNFVAFTGITSAPTLLMDSIS